MASSVSDILNAIRTEASGFYQSRVPASTRNNIGAVGDAITADHNIMNEFIDALVNKVAFSQVSTLMFSNPLSFTKRPGKPFGSTIEEIYIQPAVAEEYSTDGTKLLKTTKPDGKTAYHGLGRKDVYPVTIFKWQLVQAFNSEKDFMDLLSAIMQSLYSGDEMDEFLLMKNVLGKSIDAGAVPVVASDITQLDGPKELAKSITNYSTAFAFPSTKYCAYNNFPDNATKFSGGEKKCITACKPANQILFIAGAVQTEINYEVLATMFNMSVAQLQMITHVVDEIPSTTHDIYALLCDSKYLVARDKEYEVTSMFNGANNSWNYWLHHWEYIYTSMFANAVAFGKSK